MGFLEEHIVKMKEDSEPVARQIYHWELFTSSRFMRVRLCLNAILESEIKSMSPTTHAW